MNHFAVFSRSRRYGWRIGILVSLLASLSGGWLSTAASGKAATGKMAGPEITVIVSSASYQTTLAPDALATLYGADLATTADTATTLPLPTTLAGRRVLINDTPAALLYVGQFQINFLIPAQTLPGMATVRITDAAGSPIASKQVEIQNVAPAIFTANASGTGLPIALAQRYGANGALTYEPLTPLRFGVASEKLYLVLFLSGVRRAALSEVKVVFGSQEVAAEFVGPVDGLAGLDQINVEVPRNLQGLTRLFVKVGNLPPSNLVEIEFVPFAPLSVEPLDAEQPVTASQELKLRGSGLAEAQSVMIGGAAATIISASATEVVVRVPFGARTGPAIVETSQGKAISSKPITVRPSVSGLVANVSTATAAGLAPLAGVKVQIKGGTGGGVPLTTGNTGSYLLTNLPESCFTSFCIIQYDASGLPQRFASYSQLVRLQRDRDFQLNVVLHPLAGAISTQQQGGAPPFAQKALAPTQGIVRIPAGDVYLELPPGNQTTPAGTEVSLTLLGTNNSLGLNPAPTTLPPGVFSSRIVQIAPAEVQFTPGGKLVFPNSEAVPANAALRLYRYVVDEVNGFSAFVPVGGASLRADGLIETAADAIKTGGYYFVAAEQALAQNKLFFGRVVDASGQPLPQAEVQVRGQTSVTDSVGAFAPQRVPASFVAGKEIVLTASYRQPNGRVLFATRTYNEAALTAATFHADDIRLIEAPRPPVILAPDEVVVSANATTTFSAQIYDPDNPEDVSQLNVSFPLFPFITSSTSRGLYTFQLRPGVNDVGENKFVITVTHRGSNLTINKLVLIRVTGAPARFKVLEPAWRCDGRLPSGPVVNLAWEAAQNASGYKIYRDNLLIQEVSAPATNYTDRCVASASSFENCLVAGRSYQYRVEAVNASAVTASDTTVTATIPAQLCEGTDVTVALPTNVTGKVNDIVTIPVLIGDLTGYRAETLAYEFDLQFDGAVLEFVGPPETSGTLSQDVLYEANANSPGEAGRLRLAAIAKTGRLGGGSATLIKLKFRVRSASSSRLVFTRFLRNETALNPQEGRFVAN